MNRSRHAGAPPLTSRCCPLTNPARSLARYFAVLARSSSVPIRCIKRNDLMKFRKSALPSLAKIPATHRAEIPRLGILLLLPDLPIAKTMDDVIVHHSNRLHVRINDRRADEAESPVLQVFAECVGFGRSRWYLPRSLPVIELGPPADKTPAVGVEVLEPVLDFEKCACIAHCGFDLHPVANDLRIGCKVLDFSLGVARDFLRIEFVERAAIPFPLFQHERPVQSGLRTGEHEDLEMFAVAMNGDTPFAIVILHERRFIRAGPGAPCISRSRIAH